MIPIIESEEKAYSGDRIRWIDRIPGYHYHDTPEGQDCLKKIVFLNKVGVFFGVSAATMDIIGISKPVGAINIALRYAMITAPIMAVASTFGATTCLLTSYRGKDDTVNYTFGGFAAGAMAGALRRSGTVGTACAALFGIAGYVQKSATDNGFILFPDQKRPNNFGGPWSIHYNLSLTEERPRGWKKNEDEVLEK